MKVKSAFFTNKDETKDKVKNDLVRGIDAFERLQKVLEKKLRDRVPADDYETPSWAFKQADRNGYERAIKEVLDLIDIQE